MDRERTGDGWWVTTFVIGMVALIIAVVGVAISASKPNSTSAAGAGGAAAGGVTEVEVVLDDLSVSPNMIEVPAGEQITLRIKNEGALDHDLKVEGLTGTPMLKAGETSEVVIGPPTSLTLIRP